MPAVALCPYPLAPETMRLGTAAVSAAYAGLVSWTSTNELSGAEMPVAVLMTSALTSTSLGCEVVMVVPVETRPARGAASPSNAVRSSGEAATAATYSKQLQSEGREAQNVIVIVLHVLPPGLFG